MYNWFEGCVLHVLIGICANSNRLSSRGGYSSNCPINWPRRMIYYKRDPIQTVRGMTLRSYYSRKIRLVSNVVFVAVVVAVVVDSLWIVFSSQYTDT